MSPDAVFLFDGDCAFCTRCARYLQRHVPTTARIVPWQSVDLAPLGVTAAACAEAVQYVAPGRISSGPVAISDLLRTATGPRAGRWRLAGRLLGAPLVVPLAWPVYRLVARYRHRLPGGSAACEIPRPTRT